MKHVLVLLQVLDTSCGFVHAHKGTIYAIIVHESSESYRDYIEPCANRCKPVQFVFLEGLDANLNREKLKTTLVSMPHTLSPHQPASWISRHSQDGGKVVKQESFSARKINIYLISFDTRFHTFDFVRSIEFLKRTRVKTYLILPTNQSLSCSAQWMETVIYSQD